jgi:hypothetical protein
MDMKLLELKNFGAFDIILLALFVIYIVFPVPTPQWLVPAIDSPIGMLIIFAATVSLFVYRSPILGVLFILVAYELLRRNHHELPSSSIVLDTQYLANRVPQKLPSQQEKNNDLQVMNSHSTNTLEEEIIEKQTPIGVSNLPVMTSTTFHPVNGRTELGMTAI